MATGLFSHGRAVTVADMASARHPSRRTPSVRSVGWPHRTLGRRGQSIASNAVTSARLLAQMGGRPAQATTLLQQHLSGMWASSSPAQKPQRAGRPSSHASVTSKYKRPADVRISAPAGVPPTSMAPATSLRPERRPVSPKQRPGSFSHLQEVRDSATAKGGFPPSQPLKGARAAERLQRRSPAPSASPEPASPRSHSPLRGSSQGRAAKLHAAAARQSVHEEELKQGVADVPRPVEASHTDARADGDTRADTQALYRSRFNVMEPEEHRKSLGHVESDDNADEDGVCGWGDAFASAASGDGLDSDGMSSWD